MNYYGIYKLINLKNDDSISFFSTFEEAYEAGYRIIGIGNFRIEKTY